MSRPEHYGILDEHFFRHVWPALIGRLCRRFGMSYFSHIEEAVQSALLEAMQGWRNGVPDNPEAWLYRVAGNRLLDQLRRERTRKQMLPQLEALYPETSDFSIEEMLDAKGFEDDELRLCFIVCHPALPVRSQIILALKHLCGFSVGEIARGLMMRDEAVKKQLQRSTRKLRELEIDFVLPENEILEQRLDAVHRVLYLTFNEGYSCALGDRVIRHDVCAEASRLCHRLAVHPIGNAETRALLALMMLQAARLPARMTDEGDTILLEDQDRTLWDRAIIYQAGNWLQASRQSGRYHLEACIAMLHATTEAFAATPWAVIIKCYDALVRLDDAPIYHLNRAIAIAHHEGLDSVRNEIARLESLRDRLPGPVVPLVRAWLLEQTGDGNAALVAYRSALDYPLAPHEQRVVEGRCARLSTQENTVSTNHPGPCK